MDRAIPNPGNEEIDLYIRTIYSLLRSSGAVRLKALEETHAGMNSSLHLRATEPFPDVAALAYTYLRLPSEITETKIVLLGQSEEVFERRGYSRVDLWRTVEAPARRRKMHFHEGTLAAFINSISDIDDMIPMLVAFQMEWNKIHFLLRPPSVRKIVEAATNEERPFESDEEETLREVMGLEQGQWEQLRRLFGGKLPEMLLQMAREEKDMSVSLMASSRTDYRRATHGWWDTIVGQADQSFLRYRPVYFVSSNMHSLVNLLAGYALQEEERVVTYLRENNPESLWGTYNTLVDEGDYAERMNLLYYALKYYRADLEERRSWEAQSGIQQIENPQYLDVSAQVIELNQLIPERFDPRLRIPGLERLRESNAVIFNVDYPLGMAAYELLSQVTSSVGAMRGIYIIGKAATLNARVGDVMIPNVIYDEHSQNTFLFRNVFAADDVASHLLFSTVFDNQKAVTVRGTLLQNRDFVGVFYREGYTDIEMEGGPYLSAVYEDIYPRRYPTNEIVNLFINARYDIGILHYASDTPYSKRQALLSESLSYRGVDATYACSIAALRRILTVELDYIARESAETDLVTPLGVH